MDRVLRGAPWLVRIALLVRGVALLGARHRCPVCGWRMRAFCGPGGSFRRRESGYCPRCNSKSRHRFLYEVAADQLRGSSDLILVCSPAASELHGLRERPRFSLGLDAGNDALADASRLPLETGSIPAAAFIHVLEHVDDDRAVLSEIRRVLADGAPLVVAVPFDGRSMTDEDPEVTDPEDRRSRFGEPDHRRAYGSDIAARFVAAGFRIADVHRSDHLDARRADRIGVRPNEIVVVAVAGA